MSNSRKYTNVDGELTTVTKEHLQTATEIKLQLQEASPARRTNWSDHKKLMEKEGFFDSEKSENYRCLVKNYQRDTGQIVRAERHADLVAESKLQSIQEAVGDLYYQKRETHVERLELNKLKRQLVKTAMITEEVRDAMLDEMTFQIPKSAYEPRLPEGNHRAVLLITDWHLGAVVENVSGNRYNLDIAKKRLGKLVQETLDYCGTFEVSQLDVVMLGDAIEHISMRSVNQAYEAELPMAQQIVKASDLIINLLVTLSQHINVEYTGISGNHDRSNGDKKANIDGDNVMVVINNTVGQFIKMAGIHRLKNSHSEDELLYEAVKEINGARIKFVHGDWETKQSKNKLESHMAMDEEIYEVLVMGHYHHFEVIERNFSNKEVYVGSLMGRNNYSKKIKATSDASQAMLIIREDGEVLPIRIGLQII